MIKSERITILTKKYNQMIVITGQVEEIVRNSGIKDGVSELHGRTSRPFFLLINFIVKKQKNGKCKRLLWKCSARLRRRRAFIATRDS